jgi:HSP20 family protein
MVQEIQHFKQQPTPDSYESEGTRNIKAFTPKVDIYETEDKIVLSADIPGVDVNTVEVLLEKNILKIHGTLAKDTTEEKRRLYYAEYDSGDYSRTFTLAEDVDRDKIEATVKNGVLNVVLHKAEPVKAKKIAIKAG